MAILEDVPILKADNDRLRAALFLIQVEQLDRATDTDMSALQHRRKAMAMRDRIITILKWLPISYVMAAGYSFSTISASAGSSLPRAYCLISSNSVQ